MPTTTFIKAAFAGQTINSTLESYVPQTGDQGATFTKLRGSSLLFGTASRLVTQDAQDSVYRAGPVLSGHGEMDVAVTLVQTSKTTASLTGMTIGDEGGSSPANFLEAFIRQGTETTDLIAFGNHVSGQSTAYTTADISISNNVVYTLVVSIRGTPGNWTAAMQLLNGSTVVASIPATAMPGLVISGRAIGPRQTDAAGNSSPAQGILLTGFEAADYTAGGGGPGLAIDAPTATAGATTGTATVTVPAATGGTGPYSYQFQRAPVTGASTIGTFANVGTAGTNRTLNDTGLTPGSRYVYRAVATDSASASATSDNSNVLLVPTPGFDIVTNPASMLLRQGEALTLAVTVSSSGGYTGTPALSCVGLPTGVTASLSALSNGASTLTLTAAGNAAIGYGEVTVRGTDGSLTTDAPVMLQVDAPNGLPVVANVLDDDLWLFTREGVMVGVPASVVRAYYAG